MHIIQTLNSGSGAQTDLCSLTIVLIYIPPLTTDRGVGGAMRLSWWGLNERAVPDNIEAGERAELSVEEKESGMTRAICCSIV